MEMRIGPSIISRTWHVQRVSLFASPDTDDNFMRAGAVVSDFVHGDIISVCYGNMLYYGQP
jgi:hypothetical protein